MTTMEAPDEDDEANVKFLTCAALGSTRVAAFSASRERLLRAVSSCPLHAGCRPASWPQRHRHPPAAFVASRRLSVVTVAASHGLPCSNITIPATFVTKSTGDALKALMRGGQPVYVVMDWQDILPKKQQVKVHL